MLPDTRDIGEVSGAALAADALGTGDATEGRRDGVVCGERAVPAAARAVLPGRSAGPPAWAAGEVSVSPVSAVASPGALSDSPMAKATAVARVRFPAAEDIDELPAESGPVGNLCGKRYRPEARGRTASGLGNRIETGRSDDVRASCRYPCLMSSARTGRERG